MRYDALIIGAGMSGLAAGIRLAQFGQRVAILDRHYLWGGLNSFYKLGGRRFDVGLHALTNFVPKGTRGTPLAKILRQLRLGWDELQLGEQSSSQIAFLIDDETVRLGFANGLDLLRSEVARVFPTQVDGFERLVANLPDYADLGADEATPGARSQLSEYLDEPLLAEMLLLPVCYYGSASERDLPWDQFGVLFRSLYCEGFARPEGGIRPLLELLVARFKAAGGELCMRTGVQRVVVENGAARGVVLDDGRELEAEQIFSSAGLVETRALCGEVAERDPQAGVLSFIESLSVLDCSPAEQGHETAVTFFNDSAEFHWERPERLTDHRCGVVCSPNNYAANEPLPEGIVRVTSLAHHGLWCALPEDEYRAAKERESEAALASAARFVPDPRPHTVFKDVFTPRTIEHFTGHTNGTVYGSPKKHYRGESGVGRLHLIGTDQGMVGVIGTLMSGISMANLHGLAPVAATAAPAASTIGGPA
jgi:phytoene dehydrogenase-like protein